MIRNRPLLILAIVATILAAVPFLVATSTAPSGGMYLGATTSVDDHMVYSAWMHQARNGAFLFDNRFTTDRQPGLTIHLYFLLLGQIARFTSIPLASTLARLVFSFMFVGGVYRLIERLGWSVAKSLVTTAAVIFGGGLGFLVWHNFKGDITLPVPDIFKQFLIGRLPMDVKQPEAFVFASMLNNGLFMVSMWLITVIFNAVIDAKESAKNLIWGALGMGVLMNIHSYDVLLIGIVLTGLLVAHLYRADWSVSWIRRTLLIAAGAILPAIWFVHVLQSDAVFQARAATPTYSLNFRPVLFGLLPLIGLGLVSLWPRDQEDQLRRRGWIALASLLFALAVLAAGNQDGYFLGRGLWLVSFGLSLAIVAVLAKPGETARNLIISWAVLGLTAFYIPQLFQRKLAEGIVIPWAILAVDGLCIAVAKQPISTKKLIGAVCALLCSATSLRWVSQDFALIKSNVSTTTVESVTLSPDEVGLLSALDKIEGRKVIAAMPGIPSQTFVATPDGKGEPVPDSYERPLVNDMNTIASGLAGAYTVAGHWSETPDYMARRKTIQDIFMKPLEPAETKIRLNELGINYLIVRKGAFNPKNQNLLSSGKSVYSNPSYDLIKVE